VVYARLKTLLRQTMWRKHARQAFRDWLLGRREVRICWYRRMKDLPPAPGATLKNRTEIESSTKKACGRLEERLPSVLTSRKPNMPVMLSQVCSNECSGLHLSIFEEAQDSPAAKQVVEEMRTKQSPQSHSREPQPGFLAVTRHEALFFVPTSPPRSPMELTVGTRCNNE